MYNWSVDEERFKKEHKLHYLQPSLVFDIDPDFDEVKENWKRFLRKSRKWFCLLKKELAITISFV